MLTKPVEAGTIKCEVYWPEKVNETLTLKPTLQVRTTYIQYFADFDIHHFELSNVSKDLCYNFNAKTKSIHIIYIVFRY